MANLEKITSEDFATWLKLELNMGDLKLTDIQEAIQAFRQYNNADKAHNALIIKRREKAAKIVWVIWKKYGGPQKALEAFKAHYNDSEAFVEEIEEFIKNNPDTKQKYHLEPIVYEQGEKNYISDITPALAFSYPESSKDVGVEFEDYVTFYKANGKYYFQYEYLKEIGSQRWGDPEPYRYEDGDGPFDSLQEAFNYFIENHYKDGNFSYFYHHRWSDGV